MGAMARGGETSEAEAFAAGKSRATDAPGPRGVGTAVAFDWAIVAELLVVAALVIASPAPMMGMMGMSSFGGTMGSGSIALRLVAAGAILLAAVPVFVLGEALRRGVRLARPLQVIFSAALIVYGVVQIPDTVQELRMGHYSGLPRSAYLLVVSPLIVWWLTRPQTKHWFQTTTSAAARARHGSARWLLTIAVFAAAGGLSIALGAYY